MTPSGCYTTFGLVGVEHPVAGCVATTPAGDAGTRAADTATANAHRSWGFCRRYGLSGFPSVGALQTSRPQVELAEGTYSRHSTRQGFRLGFAREAPGHPFGLGAVIPVAALLVSAGDPPRGQTFRARWKSPIPLPAGSRNTANQPTKGWISVFPWTEAPPSASTRVRAASMSSTVM